LIFLDWNVPSCFFSCLLCFLLLWLMMFTYIL
jgi:hypothetical protein